MVLFWYYFLATVYELNLDSLIFTKYFLNSKITNQNKSTEKTYMSMCTCAIEHLDVTVCIIKQNDYNCTLIN